MYTRLLAILTFPCLATKLARTGATRVKLDLNTNRSSLHTFRHCYEWKDVPITRPVLQRKLSSFYRTLSLTRHFDPSLTEKKKTEKRDSFLICNTRSTLEKRGKSVYIIKEIFCSNFLIASVVINVRTEPCQTVSYADESSLHTELSQIPFYH